MTAEAFAEVEANLLKYVGPDWRDYLVPGMKEIVENIENKLKEGKRG